MRVARLCLALILLTFAGTGTSFSQVATGTPPFASFGGGPFDAVNLGNLNVHFVIPVLHKAGRGMPFAYDLTYDGSVWYPSSASGQLTWTPVFNWGWVAQSVANTGYMTYFTHLTECDDFVHWTTTYSAFTYYDAGGGTHSFAGTHLQPRPSRLCWFESQHFKRDCHRQFWSTS